MIVKPTVTELLKKSANRYELVIATARRARQIAAGVQNLLKNIGAAIGTSLATTMISRFGQAHQMMMVGHLNFSNDVYTQKLNALASTFASGTDIATATHMAQAQLYNQLLQQASLWGYVETFRYFGAAAFIIIPLVVIFIRHKKTA